MYIHIFVIYSDGEREEIKDLYWFEENGVHGFDGEGNSERYAFEIVINDEPCPKWW